MDDIRNDIKSRFNKRIFSWVLFPVVFPLLFSCAHIQPVQFRAVRNISIDMDNTGTPLLKGQAVFFNPNHLRMKLKEVKMEVLVEGKKSAVVDQKPDLTIPANAEFTAFVEAHLSLQDIGLLDTVMSLFGGKKYEIQYVGYVRVKVHGVAVKVPINFTDHMTIKL